jgi:EAL domain-containing protein (putative c-di-GMP-specific phosphodiesterase class I)
MTFEPIQEQRSARVAGQLNQASILRDLGVTAMQGYALGRPDFVPALQPIEPVWVSANLQESDTVSVAKHLKRS